MGIYIPGLKGNAMVLGNAPIQPPQAFVDNVAQWFTSLSNSDGTLNLANKGITFINPGTTVNEFGVFAFCEGASPFSVPVMDFRGNAMPSSNINGILAACVAQGVPGGILQLEGGTNGAPTGQGIVDKATLITVNSWTVTTN